MATTRILNGASANATSAGTAVTGAATVNLSGTFAGAKVEIQAARNDVAGEYAPVGIEAQVTGPKWLYLNIPGAYFVRTVISGVTAEKGTPSITADLGQ